MPMPFGKVGLAKHFKLEQHHMIPWAFKELAEHAGLNINDFVKLIPAWKHRLLPLGIHTGPEGVNYNSVWRAFQRETINVTKSDILQFMDHLEARYGLTKYPWQVK
jgi:hypothetical protein